MYGLEGEAAASSRSRCRSFEETNDGHEHSGVDAAADWPVLELVTVMVLVLLLDLRWLPAALVNVLISSSLVVLFFR